MPGEVPLDCVVGQPAVTTTKLEEHDARAVFELALSDELMGSNPEGRSGSGRSATAPGSDDVTIRIVHAVSVLISASAAVVVALIAADL